MELIQALEDLLWWVQDGLDNADMTTREYRRTVKGKEVVLEHISNLKRNTTRQPVESDLKSDVPCPIQAGTESFSKPFDRW